MTNTRSGSAGQSPRPAHEPALASRQRAGSDGRPELVTIAGLDEGAERGVPVTPAMDVDEVSDGQVMRTAVNDLQHRLLVLDPQADVLSLALERLMTAASADRVCAFKNSTGLDGRDEYALDAEAAVSPSRSLLGADEAAAEAYEDFIPGLFQRLG